MTGGIQDDVRQKFSQLHRAGGKSLVLQMLEIQACQIRQPSFQHWQQFTCLCLSLFVFSSSADEENYKEQRRTLNSEVPAWGILVKAQ